MIDVINVDISESKNVPSVVQQELQTETQRLKDQNENLLAERRIVSTFLLLVSLDYLIFFDRLSPSLIMSCGTIPLLLLLILSLFLEWTLL